MNSRKGKSTACWITGAGLLVLIACGVAFKDRAVEQYWLWKLESEDLEEQRVAAEKLAEMGSVRAVPVILELLRNLNEEELNSAARASSGQSPGDLQLLVDTLSSTGWKTGSTVGSFDGSVIWDASTGRLVLAHPVPADHLFLVVTLWKITAVGNKACVPYLIEALDGEPAHVRYPAATCLAMIGLDARGAVPALIEALKEPMSDEKWGTAVRCEIARALGQIGPAAEQSIPALTAASQDDNEAIRQAAAEALKKIQGHEEPAR